MAKQSITNRSPGVRVLNAKNDAGQVVQVSVRPGETLDLDVLNDKDPVFAGMVKMGDLIVGKPGTKPLTPDEKVAADLAEAEARAKAAHDAGYAEGFTAGQAKAVEDAAKAKAAAK